MSIYYIGIGLIVGWFVVSVVLGLALGRVLRRVSIDTPVGHTRISRDEKEAA